jgi:hypothetical protein
MPVKPPVRDNNNARVEARTALCRELGKPEHADRRAQAGLLDEDLASIVADGEEAQAQDRLQHEDLAGQRKDQQDTLAAREDFENEYEALRRRLPAVIMNLTGNAATADLAGWLAAATFARFRIRTVTPPSVAGAPTAPPAAAERQRVLRGDRLSRAQSVSQFLQALLQPERAAIVEAMGRRGMARDRLSALARTADTLVAKLGDKALLKRSDATAREATAVGAQKEKWEACRRMVRSAVRGGPDLERLFASC